MKILFISRYYKNDVLGGGQEMVTYTYAKHLSKMGHTVALAAYKLTRNSPDFFEDTLNGYSVYRVGGIHTLFISRLFGFIRVVRKFNPDIIVMTSYQQSIYGWFIGWMTNKKVVAIINDDFEVHGYGIKPFNSFHFINRKFFSHKINKIIALNNNVANIIFKETGLKIPVCTTPLDMPGKYPIKTKYRKYLPTGDKFTFVFLSRLYVEKGPQILAEAFTEFNKEYPNSRCIFIGAGKYLDKLRKDWGDNPNIEILGFVEEERVFQILSEADIFVTPTYIKEGIILTNIQAMKIGLPVISTDTGASSEAVRDLETGILVMPKSSKWLKEFMIFASQNENIMSRFAKNGLEESKKYDGEENTKEFLRELDEL
jgi:glycosyltransferase involved in cell wall biosynthesis